MTAARVSVCMATYNGSAYVREQLESILWELEPQDEVIIVDDASRDDTAAIIRAIDDDRIRLQVRESNVGYVRAFEQAMAGARGDVIMLSDQDDVWIPGRRAAFVEALRGAGVAASNLVLLGSDAPLPSPIRRVPWRLSSRRSRQRVRNELRILAGIAPYFGCAMAVRRDMLPRVLPFPSFLVESHDLWLATFANAHGLLVHIDQPTIRRRLHAENTSPSRPRGIAAVLRARLMLARAWMAALGR
ncbi:glycosyltransferase [Microbacterium sp. zg-Y818]|uniref:glycosyltransferase n=1 Tax=unclassified Microbacterium TaxID=2609290 RepID=UPI00214CFE01|nr:MULTISPECIES: glycosyltransferase [unclassified Microbacterium]MCR2801711.1 glycosyltransferase [Microbacterium sp. zg.Y818]WIM23022.1 glycosyltransferase [Microbacterium sp. zg-Y818]